MTAGLEPGYERRVRFALRAFPRRFRAVRTDEVLSTLADLDAGRRKRPAFRTLIDLVRAGWAVRLRTHPPLLRWLWYCAGGKLPPEYYAWLLDDLSGFFRLSLLLRAAVALIPMLLLRLWVGGLPGWAWLAWLAIVLVYAYRGRHSARLRIRRQHGSGELPLPIPVTSTPALVIRQVVVACRAAPAFLCLGIALVAMVPVGIVAFFGKERVDPWMIIDSSALERWSLVHRWGIGVGCLATAVLFGVASLVLTPRLWRRMEWRARSSPCPALPTGPVPPVGTLLIVVSACAGLNTLLLPMAAVVLAAGGLGPCLIVLGVAALRLERRIGSPVPMPFVRHRAVVTPAPTVSTPGSGPA